MRRTSVRIHHLIYSRFTLLELLHVCAAHTLSHTEGIDKHRPDWDDVKYDVLLTILRAKFSQHPDLASKLVRSKTADLGSISKLTLDTHISEL